VARACSHEVWSLWRSWEERWRADLRRHLRGSWRTALLFDSLALAAAEEGDLDAARSLVAERLSLGSQVGSASMLPAVLEEIAASNRRRGG
jgi:hypothetical protein